MTANVMTRITGIQSMIAMIIEFVSESAMSTIRAGMRIGITEFVMITMSAMTERTGGGNEAQRHFTHNWNLFLASGN
jgi:hypothetical protein